MIFNLFKKKPDEQKTAIKIYEQIVAQARQPVFYTDYCVEDSISGRFEMIVLHAYMLFHRLRDENNEVRDLGQKVFDRFFYDMDSSLRQQGVGDLSVPKKIKKMAQAFYGHVEAYDDARAQDLEALANVLSRNVYAMEDGTHAQAKDLARYVLDSGTVLAALSSQDIVKGVLAFAEPEILREDSK